jgi:hypothetical protein
MGPTKDLGLMRENLLVVSGIEQRVYGRANLGRDTLLPGLPTNLTKVRLVVGTKQGSFPLAS